MTTPHAPALFVSHGAPTWALEPGAAGADLSRFAAAHPRPRAVAIVSAHWSADRVIGVTSAAHPKLVYDFHGFPDALYRIAWPAPGAPDVAARVVSHLEAAGFRAALDPVRGLDHGAWVPLRVLFPDADVPVVQVALPELPPDGLVRFGAALAPLRREGVAVVASGGLVHNLRAVRFAEPDAPPDAWAAAFDAWVAGHVAAGDLDALLRWRELAPSAALAAPTSEHLDPLFVALGAREPGDRLVEVHAGMTYGNLGMRSFAFLPPDGPAPFASPHERSNTP